jgi:indole-3-glycerol phosphate synthase
METILTRITDYIREKEAENFRNFSDSTAEQVDRQPPIDIPPLMEKQFFLVAEAKKGSPSKGIIRPDYHPAVIAADYERAGASAVSVITEPDFFYGSKLHLPLVKQTVNLPVLRKDFILHPFQVYESFNLGADFLLLIAACLTDEELEKLYRLTLSLGMQALVEVHTREELDRVLQLHPRIIGINNRDLKTFQTDIGTSFALKKFIPGDIFVISESGICSHEDITALKNAGFAGALVGESLLRQTDPAAALKQLIKDKKNES